MLRTDNLNVYCLVNKKKEYLLKDISFSLSAGDCLGIIGKSGDGKSTLAKALLEIYDNNVCLESGKIFIDNKPFNKLDRGKKIVLLFQNPNSYLNPLMKVGKQIQEVFIYHYKMKKNIAKVETLSLMKKVGLDGEKVYDYYPYEISGGMQQKVCLCIALACNPEILVLDEFTSYLDTDSKKEIMQLIKDLQKEKHFSLIVISHNFKEIFELCNKIAVMRKGRMIEFGNKEEIILDGKHPYTIELFLDYMRYYENIDSFECPLMNIELLESAPITWLSETHYIRSWFLDKRAMKINLPYNLKELRRKLYASLTSK